VRPIPGQSRWKIESAVLVWLAVLVISAVIVVVVGGIAGVEADDERQAWQLLVSASALWIPALIGVRYVSRHEGSGRLVPDFGLRFRPVDIVGLGIGVLCQLVMIEVLYLPLRAAFPSTFSEANVEKPAQELVAVTTGPWVLIVGIVLIVGAPLMEELLYRGLIFRALESRLTGWLAVVLSSLWFGLAHFSSSSCPGSWRSGWCSPSVHCAQNASACRSSRTLRSTRRPTSCNYVSRGNTGASPRDPSE
jgi:uncharacterized protein